MSRWQYTMESGKNPMCNPISRTKAIEAGTKAARNPITRRIISRGTREKWNDKEYREKMIKTFNSPERVAKIKRWHKKHAGETSLSNRGPNNPNWKGGSKKFWKHRAYRYGFTKELRDKVFERDGSRCVDCGLDLQKVSLSLKQIHHIDFDKTNNSMDNLITLCTFCHMNRHYGGD